MEEKKKRKKRRKRKRRKSNIISNIILAIAILVFLFASFMLIKSLLPYWQGNSGYKKIQKLAIEQKDEEEQTPTTFSVDFDELLKLNPDTIGWIRFDEPSVINYPIVQGKDNDQYLYQSFTADDNKLGTIFMNMYNHSDFGDRETIIYGHNMSYGSDMFTKLNEYESADFCREHPYFYIYTPNGNVITYQVFAAEQIAEDSEIYGVDFIDDEAFTNRVNLIKSQALYDTGAEVSTGNQIMVLSTCTNTVQTQRFIVVGVKISDEPVVKE